MLLQPWPTIQLQNPRRTFFISHPLFSQLPEAVTGMLTLIDMVSKRLTIMNARYSIDARQHG